MVPPAFATSAIRLATGDAYHLFLQLWHGASIPVKALGVGFLILAWKTCIDLAKKIDKKLGPKDLEVVNTKIDGLQKDMSFIKKTVIDIALAKKN